MENGFPPLFVPHLSHTYNNVENSDIPEDRSYDHDSEGYVPETLDTLTHVILRVLRTLDEVIMVWSWKVRVCLLKCWSQGMWQLSHPEENLTARSLHCCSSLSGRRWGKQLWNCKWTDREIHLQYLSFALKVLKNYVAEKMFVSVRCLLCVDDARDTWALASSSNPCPLSLSESLTYFCPPLLQPPQQRGRGEMKKKEWKGQT